MKFIRISDLDTGEALLVNPAAIAALKDMHGRKYTTWTQPANTPPKICNCRVTFVSGQHLDTDETVAEIMKKIDANNTAEKPKTTRRRKQEDK